MNALRVLLTFIIILYLIFYEPGFWKYFFLILIPYYILTQLIFADHKINSPKNKFFIGAWTHPFDSQIYGVCKLNITRLEEFLKAYSLAHGREIHYTVFVLKMMAMILVKYPQINGNVIFGHFLAKQTIDISCMVASEGGFETDMMTIKECDKMSLEEISLKIAEKRAAIENRTDKNYNRRMLLAKLLPTFLMSPFVRIMSYLSICGANLTFIGLPKYAFGTCIVCNLGKIGIGGAFLPIPPYTYAPILLAISEKKKVLDDQLRVNTYVKIYITVDHRYMDGSLAAKIGADCEKITNEPELLFNPETFKPSESISN